MKPALISWIARVICMLAIAFVMMFSADCFGGEAKLSEQLVCFVMHNIPAFVLILLLVIAWRQEFAGGVIFAGVALLISLFFLVHAFDTGSSIRRELSLVLMFALPFLVVGLLFIWSYNLRKKNHTSVPGNKDEPSGL